MLIFLPGSAGSAVWLSLLDIPGHCHTPTGSWANLRKTGWVLWHSAECGECDAALSPEEAKVTPTGQMCVCSDPATMLPPVPERKRH